MTPQELKKLKGRRVVRNDGVMGTIIGFDGLSVRVVSDKMMETGIGQATVIGMGRFFKIYRILDPEDSPKEITKQVAGISGEVAPLDINNPEPESKPRKPRGEKGCGTEVKLLFFTRLYNTLPESEFVVTFSEDKTKINIQYLGRRVFYLEVKDRCLDLYCNAKALSPQNRAKVYKYHPNKAALLRALFVFTGEGDTAMLRALILDVLYYEQSKEERSLTGR